MNIEDYFLNLGWICVDSIENEILLEILGLSSKQSANWKDGYETIINSFDDKVFLNFKIQNWEILISKYLFMDSNVLKAEMNKLSRKSREVNSFAIDVWSNFYCYSKSINGKNIRHWIVTEDGDISEGEITKEESEIFEIEKANQILELAGQTTIKFNLIEDFLSRNEIQILK